MKMTTSGDEPLTMLSISDIHLGPRNVPTPYIISGLDRYVCHNPSISKIKIIWLVGDVFDESLLLGSEDAQLIREWIVRFLIVCKRHDICVRVLEGTPSHDRKQSRYFEALNRISHTGADVKYVDTLSIEYIERFNINVLYVPDEWRGRTSETQEEVSRLLEAHRLPKVDYALMHGSFRYQVPEVANHDCHEMDFYLGIVEKYIFIGHEHTASRYDRILAQGSFERLGHGQESAKGFYYVSAYPNGSTQVDKITFVENKQAARFVTTVLPSTLSKEETTDRLRQTLEAVSDKNEDGRIPVHIRLEHDKANPNMDVINAFIKLYPDIRWSNKIKTSKLKRESEQNELPTLVPSVYQPIPLNENTIVSVMENRLQSAGVDPQEITVAMELLTQIKGGQYGKQTSIR